MHSRNSRFLSLRLCASFTIASLVGVIGCGTTSVSSPSLPSSLNSMNKTASGPMLGYVWDKTASGLRPILGVPGAAQFGSPIYGGAGYNNAVACPDKKYALLTSSGGQAFLGPLPSGVPVQIADHLSTKEQIAISPSCSAALLYAPGTSSATLILGLPATPTAQTINLSQAGQVTTAAVSDSGLILAAVGKAASGSTIQAISADGTAMQLTTVAGLGGMTFLPSSQNALIADSGRNTIWSASGLPNTTALNSVAATADGVRQPIAVASSSDGRWLIVANQNGAAILRLDLTRQTAPTQIACRCSAVGLTPLSGNNTFLLSAVDTGPVWTFDGDSPSPRVVFIPAIKQTGAAGVTR